MILGLRDRQACCARPQGPFECNLIAYCGQLQGGDPAEKVDLRLPVLWVRVKHLNHLPKLGHILLPQDIFAVNDNSDQADGNKGQHQPSHVSNPEKVHPPRQSNSLRLTLRIECHPHAGPQFSFTPSNFRHYARRHCASRPGAPPNRGLFSDNRVEAVA